MNPSLPTFRRREFVVGAAGILAAVKGMLAQAPERAAGGGPEIPDGAAPLSYAALKGRARVLAQQAYQAPLDRLPPPLTGLTWDQYEGIVFRMGRALWAGSDLSFRAAFFHLGLFYRTPVRMHEVVGGRAREIAFDPAMFDYARSVVDGSKLPADLGLAGFRLFARGDFKRDVAAFLGASYFRAVGEEMQYGMSARGLAIDTGSDTPEEFPMFTEYWIERPSPGAPAVTVHALLDSPSVAGAYRFLITPGPDLVMDVDAALYPRRPIGRLGVVPLTSMYFFGANDRRMANDWRPQIHDSEGLAMWTGAGEWIWRPLVNPEGVRFNAYQDRDPRGFGLLQRDRNFDHYQDDGAFYNLRPSVWVEPKGSWGPGSVQLLELPAADETIDNIAAFWNPARRPLPGEELLFAYRLSWGSRVPVSPPLAQVVATRTGIGGPPGETRRYFSWRFVVDFAGGGLASLPRDTPVEPVISASRGQVEITSARPLDSVHGYRAMFDLKPTDESPAPVNLRLYLRAAKRALSETWMYQWNPPANRSF